MCGSPSAWPSECRKMRSHSFGAKASGGATMVRSVGPIQPATGIAVTYAVRTPSSVGSSVYPTIIAADAGKRVGLLAVVPTSSNNFRPASWFHVLTASLSVASSAGGKLASVTIGTGSEHCRLTAGGAAGGSSEKKWLQPERRARLMSREARNCDTSQGLGRTAILHSAWCPVRTFRVYPSGSRRMRL